MAKICYLTGEPVLYIDCLECEKKEYCRKKKKKKWDIGGVEGCGKVEGKGGSPEASEDGGGRLGKGW